MCIPEFTRTHLKIGFDGEFGRFPPRAIGKGGKEPVPTNDGRIFHKGKSAI
jgi:hypothetical protein